MTELDMGYPWRNTPITLPELQEWAFKYLEDNPEPHRIIGDNYMHRWHLVPRNFVGNVMLNKILRSDADRCLHDHPWDNHTWLLAGRYKEITEEGTFHRYPGAVVSRKATDKHRIELFEEGEWSLSFFVTGPKIRDWGFWPDGEFVFWRDYEGIQAAL